MTAHQPQKARGINKIFNWPQKWWLNDQLFDPGDNEKNRLRQMVARETDEDGLERLWTRLRDLREVENSMFNARFSALLAANAFLMAAAAQFVRADMAWLGFAIAVAGFLSTAIVTGTLFETGRALRWYQEALHIVEEKLHPGQDDDHRLRPYWDRRLGMGMYDRDGKYLKLPLSQISAALSAIILVLWLLTAGFCLWRSLGCRTRVGLVGIEVADASVPIGVAVLTVQFAKVIRPKAKL